MADKSRTFEIRMERIEFLTKGDVVARLALVFEPRP